MLRRARRAAPGTRAPRGLPPRGGAAQGGCRPGFRRPGVCRPGFAAQGYGPPGLQPGRVRAFVTVIRALRPGWGANTRPRGFAAQGFALGYGPAALQAAPGTCIRCLQTPTLLADGCRDRRRRLRAFRVSYRPRPASWDPSASRHRASSVPSVPWAAWDLWDPSAA